MHAVECSHHIVGSGPVLYLVHGIGARKSVWNDIVDGLKEFFTCVIYDLRGHGGSPVAEVPYSLDELVADLESLRQKLGHRQIHIAGHSLGGMIGPAYALAYPEKVLSLSLLSTAAGRSEQDRTKLKVVGQSMQEKGVLPVLSTFVERWYTEEFIQTHPKRILARLKQVEQTPEAVFLSVFQIYATTEMAPWLHEIKCPCLVLTGELDAACNPRLNRFIDSELQNSKLVILEGLKHSILMEAPQRVLKPLLKFLLQVNNSLSN
ncbi:MAG: alpha/beta fold hydrolase [Arenicella sp.]